MFMCGALVCYMISAAAGIRQSSKDHPQGETLLQLALPMEQSEAQLVMMCMLKRVGL